VRVRASRPCLLGIDLGTGSTKAVLVDDSGQTVGVGVSANEVRSPRPGWVESDPEAWWASTCNAVGRALSAATTGDRPPQVVGIGLSGQMHGAVLVGADARPLGPAVLWADQRALAEADRYRALPEALRQAVGNPVAPGMTGPVLLWLEANEPERYGSARWALVAKDWLRARLTGELASDPSDASGTLLADLERRAWSPEVTGALGLRPSLLPPILASDALGGSLLASAASALRLAAGLPVAVGAGDTAAALVGQGPPGLGVVVLNVGTGAQAVVRRLRPEPDERLRYHVFAEAGSGYFALAAVQAAGLAFEWAWRALGCDWAEAYRLLGEAPSGARGVVFVPHLAGSRSPDMAPRASGGFVGARLASSRAELVRAVFEGVAFSIRAAAECLPELGPRTEVRLVGGGSLEPAWRQLLADALGRPLVVASAEHASARGAALLAARVAGVEVGDGGASGEPAAVVEVSAEAGSLADAYGRWREWCERLLEPPG
jgi:xylulokinase